MRTSWDSHAGRGRAPRLLRLTGQSWRPRPPGSHSPQQRSCLCSGPGPGPPATRPRSQRRGRWRRHGPPGAWEAWGWGLEELWSVDSRVLGLRPSRSPEERPSEKGQVMSSEKITDGSSEDRLSEKMTESQGRPGFQVFSEPGRGSRHQGRWRGCTGAS